MKTEHPERAHRLVLATMLTVAAAFGLLLVTGCGSSDSGSTSETVASSGASDVGFDAAAAEKYCTDQSGQLVDRVATWNTNGAPSTWVQLAGKKRLCEFESGTGDSTTRISVDLVTLYAEQPTLAGLAYLSKLPVTLPETPSSNPAAYNCTAGLGGARNFGNGLATGGGWVDEAQPVFKVVSLCVFADGSAIDEFGIFYYADGTVRGADLATKMRYQASDPPPIFTPRT